MAKRDVNSHNDRRGNKRADQEMNEKQDTVPVDGPSERFQTEAQIDDAQRASKIQTPDSQYTLKKTKANGGVLKQEVAAKVLGEKGAGSRSSDTDVSPASSYGLRSIEFSGDTGTLLGNVSGTPILDKDSQGGTRVEKRLSDVNKDINYLASEQILVEYDNIPPLAESDKNIGYNGNPANIAARSQKKTGLTPAELLYDRSVDFLLQDGFVFTTGQVVKQSGVSDASYPTKTYVNQPYEVNGNKRSGWHSINVSGDDPSGDTTVYPAQARGNYAPREIQITFKKDAGSAPYVAGFKVIEDDFSANDTDYRVVNKACGNHVIDLNCAELSRQTIDQEAGSPNADHYNPLGRSVDQPSRTVMYLRDIESSTGATMFMAYKFAQKARGFYLNRTAKDGQDLITPALDALYGHLMADSSSESIYKTLGGSGSSVPNIFFNTKGMKLGSAAIMPALFGSMNQFKTKADFVTHPKGLRLPLQTADNNLNPFRVKREFVAAINSIDAFSTIDRGYDPMSSVAILDNVRLVYPYSWAKMLAFTRKSASADRVYTSKLFTYKYAAGNGAQTYYVKVADPVLNGIAYFAELHASQIFNTLYNTSDGDKDNEVVWHIPVVHSTTHFSLWDLLVCASAPYIIYERTNSLKDILDFQQYYKYPFPEFVPLKEANPMNAVNYGNPSALQPLEVKQMLPSSAIRWILPELMTPIGEDLMLPWYFNEQEFSKGGTSSDPTLTQSGKSMLTTPVIRSGVRLSYLDDFYGMDVEDVLLSLDRLVVAPTTAVFGQAFHGYTYKYSQDSDGIPVVHGTSALITVSQYHAIPRQLGWFMPAFAGECCVDAVYGDDDPAATGFGAIGATENIAVGLVGSSFRAIMYRSAAKDPYDGKTRSGILMPGSIAVNRAQAFTQKWVMRRAAEANNGSSEFDVLLSPAEGITTSGSGASTAPTIKASASSFRPFVWADYYVNDTNDPQNIYSAGPALFAPHRMFWGLIQKLPFVLNPFDAIGSSWYDPFGFAYIFGLAGFYAADYSEMEYNRMVQRQNLGFGYVQDPFIQQSPVFRDAMRFTEIG